MAETNPKVDGFIRYAESWQKEFEALRKILLDSSLAEEMKWGCPCYTHDKRNVALIHGFKEYCAVLFFKGALMKDAKNLLVKPGENSQAGRQMRFAKLKDVTTKAKDLKAYLAEAIRIEESGEKVTLKKTAEYDVPQELQERLDENPELKKSFQALTPGRQRAYLLHFSQAKQSKTRASRVEKCIPRILDGKGLDD